MSGHGGGGGAGGALKDLWYFIILIIFIWIVWYLLGGIYNTNKDKPFMKPDFVGNSGEVYGPADIPPAVN